MRGAAADVQIETGITYSLKAQSFNKPLKLVNKSQHTYIFKIKTNQKTVISLQTTHDFLMPKATRQIAIKLADKPSETSQLKLEFNYAIASQQDVRNKDSKMTSYAKENVFRVVVPVHRMEEGEKVQLQNVNQKSLSMSVPMSTPRKVEDQLTTKIQITPEADVMSGKGQTIDITNSLSSPVSRPKEEIKQKVEMPTTPVHFKSVESSEIKVEAAPQAKQDPSLYHSARQVREETTSPLRTSQRKEKTEQEVLISELQQKILKERSTIKSLQYSSTSNSFLPFPAILGLLIVSFCMGSLLSYVMM